MRLIPQERSPGEWLFQVIFASAILFFLVASELRHPDDRIWPWSLLFGGIIVMVLVSSIVRYFRARERDESG